MLLIVDVPGGSIGAESIMELDAAVKVVQDIHDAAVAERNDVIVLCHGGPISTPEDAQYILTHTKGVHGFYGASSAERMPVEIAIKEHIKKVQRDYILVKRRGAVSAAAPFADVGKM